MKYNVVVRPTQTPRTWQVVFGFCYKELDIPTDFIFDGASVPIGLRWLFPHGGAQFPAACLHDYAYRYGKVDKETADRYFLEIMIANGVPKWKAVSMYNSVKCFGSFAWRKRRKEDGIRKEHFRTRRNRRQNDRHGKL